MDQVNTDDSSPLVALLNEFLEKVQKDPDMRVMDFGIQDRNRGKGYDFGKLVIGVKWDNRLGEWT